MNKCFECEATEDLQEHHPVPRSRGGTKTVTLCYECHMKAHGRDSKGMNHGRLTEEGLQQAKRNGVKLGSHNPKVLKGITESGNRNLERIWPHIQKARKQGVTSISNTRDYLNNEAVLTTRGKRWTRGNVQSLLVRIKKLKEE